MYKLIKKSLCMLMAMLFMLGVFSGDASAERAGIRDGVLVNGGLLAVMTDGTVQFRRNDAVILDDYYYPSAPPKMYYADWKGITQLALCNSALAGLREDGTVAVTGAEEYVREILTWDHIIKLYSVMGEYNLIAGLREDGTVKAVGHDPYEMDAMENGEQTYCEQIASLKNVQELIIGTCAAGGFIAALHRDGTVTPSNSWNESPKDIVFLDSSGWGRIALRNDGTCVVGGGDAVGWEATRSWKNLKQVGCGDTLAVGLCKDGTFIATRDDLSEDFYALRDIDHFECSVENTIIAYRKDGTVEVMEYSGAPINSIVHEWTDIERILAVYPIIVGLKTDGSLVCSEGRF